MLGLRHETVIFCKNHKTCYGSFSTNEDISSCDFIAERIKDGWIIEELSGSYFCPECAKKKALDEHIEEKQSAERRVKYLEACLKRMQDIYVEKRSDVSDMIESILNCSKVTDVLYLAEKRFVKFKYQGADFVYDSLTTQVSTNGSPKPMEFCFKDTGEEWNILECEYED